MSLVSVLSAPVAGFLMDQFGIILALYLACGLVSLGQLIITIGAFTNSFQLMVVGRVVFGLGFEPTNSGKNIIVAKWFGGGELSLASNITLATSRTAVFLNGYFTPWFAYMYGYG